MQAKPIKIQVKTVAKVYKPLSLKNKSIMPQWLTHNFSHQRRKYAKILERRCWHEKIQQTSFPYFHFFLTLMSNNCSWISVTCFPRESGLEKALGASLYCLLWILPNIIGVHVIGFLALHSPQPVHQKSVLHLQSHPSMYTQALQKVSLKHLNRDLLFHHSTLLASSIAS